MWMMLQTEKPDNFVIGTGETHSIEEFLEFACSYLDLDMSRHIKFDQKYFRPTEVDELKADARKSAAVLGWKPRIKFQDLVKIMLDADLRANGITPPGEGDALIAKKFPCKWWKGD
jgi:GDPmannose 4,6-dehydratase